MKLIVAHLASDAFDSVRRELRELGVQTTTITQVHTSAPATATTLRYRGIAVRTHLRPALKLECVVSDEQSPAVVRLLRGHANDTVAAALRVAVLDLEEQYEAPVADDVYPGDPRLDTAFS